ncbi:hypothetical protein ERJ75_001494800 [Trypanosoma vivax]|nr:hypothetical protein ERJ75_001494800 [Trypanosoma vivax]
MAAVFVDYARPFDSVDHGCIAKGLLPFGVGKHLVAWIAGFLKGRTAKVRVNKVLSEDVGLTVVSLKARTWDRCCSLSRWIR